MWVLLFHVQSFANGYGAPWLKSVPLLADGWVGVDLFFVLSGFILMFVHEADFGQLRGRVVVHFAALRFFRIYPLATAVLILIALLVLADAGFAVWYRKTHDPADLTAMAFLRTLLLATRWYPPFVGDWNQPVWSLSVEIIGYCAAVSGVRRHPHYQPAGAGGGVPDCTGGVAAGRRQLARQ